VDILEHRCRGCFLEMKYDHSLIISISFNIFDKRKKTVYFKCPLKIREKPCQTVLLRYGASEKSIVEESS
jgi:hypothetical protein